MTKISKALGLAITLGLGGTAALHAGMPPPGGQAAQLCGADHSNEVAGPGDVTWTEAGFRIESLNEVVAFDDDRLVFADERGSYLCTEATGDARSVRWLLIPRNSLF